LHRGVLHLAEHGADAGVVDQDVERAEALLGERDGELPVGLAGDVEAHEDALGALGADLRLDGVTVVLQHVTDHDPRALAREQLRLGRAHAARAAADESDLARESHPDLPCSRIRGSSASRTASPTKLRPTTVTKSAAPGPKTIQGACCRYRRPALIMLPHDASGGWMPSPRNDSEASARIAKATLSEACTTMGAVAFGSTWL